MEIGAIILGAGQGTRMCSKKPKVLHKILNKPLISYVKESVEELLTKKPIVVIGHGGEFVKEYLGEEVFYGVQNEQLGTGHAVKCALDQTADLDQVFVLCGDTPLLTAKTLKLFLESHLKTGSSGSVLTARLEDSSGYGRIIKEIDGTFSRIVEEKDASPEEKQEKEVNSGTYIFNREDLVSAIEKITTNNAQGEYYLTDVLTIFKNEGLKVEAYCSENSLEINGINNRKQLAEAARILQAEINEVHMARGVTLEDPATAYIGSRVQIGMDSTIGANVHLEGDTIIGEDVVVGANSTIVDSIIGPYTNITHSLILESSTGENCLIGPFAYIRPNSKLGDKVKVGDFVELKKTQVGDGSKIPHHSYIGDSEVGAGVNIGAGTITCNYDGSKKFKTIIGDGSFIGSNTNLVAPLTIGTNAYVGAGSTITEDIPDDALGVARGKQKNIDDWNKK